MLYVDTINNEELREVVMTMISGMLPYSDDYISKIKIYLEQDMNNMKNLKLLEANKDEIEESKYKSKKLEVEGRLHNKSDYAKYLTDEINYFDDNSTSMILDKVLTDKIKYQYEIFERITKYIKLEEFDMDLYVILSMLSSIIKMNGINIRRGLPGNIVLNKNLFDKSIDRKVQELVESKREELGVKKYMQQKDIKISSDIDLFIDEAYSLTIDMTQKLYDKCSSLNISSEEALASEIMYRSLVLESLVRSSAEAQLTILTDKLTVGRRTYMGPEDSFEYSKMSNTEIESRMSETVKKDYYTFADKELFEDEDSDGSPQDICNIGIPSLDEVMKLQTRKLHVVVAPPSTGKTQFAIDAIARAILNKKKVLYVCTEQTVREASDKILASIIMKMKGVAVPSNMLTSVGKLTKNQQILVRLLKSQLRFDDLLFITSDMKYGEFREKTSKLIEDKGIDMVVVDHTLRLIKDGSQPNDQAYVSTLGGDCIYLKNTYPVCMFVTSQMTPEALNELKTNSGIVDRDTNSTKYAAALKEDADSVLILYRNSDLLKRGVIQVQVQKWRAPETPSKLFLLRIDTSIHHTSYHAEDQGISRTSADSKDVVEKARKAIGGI